MPAVVTRPAPRFASWLARWSGILPLLGAEFIAWVGFGALLPVMPLYFTEHGVDLATLGIVVAAWPAARLVGEPVFGWLADRIARVPLMVAGLVVTAIAMGLPLVLIGPGPFLVSRALAGLATAAYDPAARGYLTDATPSARRGEAFGLYGAAQMGGLLLGPAIGGLGAALVGGYAFTFAFAAAGTLLAAAAVAIRVREQPAPHHRTALAHDLGDFPIESPVVYERGADDRERDEAAIERSIAPARLANRLLVAALLVNVGSYFAGGAYEVIWSLFLTSKGAGLDLVGLTFATFGLPVLLLSPVAGRIVDRRGPFPFVVAGSLGAIVASVGYTVVGDVVLVLPFLVIEATGFALLNPALYAVVAAGSPRGRSSTAQGIYGAAGTVGTITSALVAGAVAGIDLRWPFWLSAIVLSTSLGLGLTVGGVRLRRLVPSASPPPAAPASVD